MSKLDHLRELHAETNRVIRSNASGDESMKAIMRFADEMDRAVPSLLGVCDAYVALLIECSINKCECPENMPAVCDGLDCEECAQLCAQNKLEEMLG
jgi:hypothetical protein